MGLSKEIISRITHYAYANNWDFDAENFKQLKQLADVNDPIKDLTLLFRVANDKKIDYAEKLTLINSLKNLGTVLPIEEVFLLENLKIRSSTRNPKELVCYIGSDNTAIELLRVLKSDFYETAIKQGLGTWINYLIEKNYIENPNFGPQSSGGWIRLIGPGSIDNEIKVLEKRNNLTPSQLSGHGKKYKKELGNASTDYSPATYVLPPYKINLFSKMHKTGVFIRQDSERVIDYWYSGLSEERLTDDLDFDEIPLKMFKGLPHPHGHIGAPESIIHNQYPDCVKDWGKFKKLRFDQYGVLERNYGLRWNEGLFRYKASEVGGIYVDPDSKISIKGAFDLREKLINKLKLNESKLPFFTYDPYTAILKKISQSALEESLKTQPAIPPRKTFGT